MKTLTIAIALLSILSVSGFAQGLLVRQSAEKTAFGTYSGISLNYVNRNGVQLGAFYSGRTNLFQEASLPAAVSEKYFFGISSSYPLTHFRKVNFHVQMRVGSTNETRLTYAPALAATFHPTSRFALEAGVSNRLYGYGAFLNVRYTLKSFANMAFEGERSGSRVSRYF